MKFNYVKKCLKRELQRLTEDFPLVQSILVSEAKRELKTALIVFEEGTGYLGSSKSVDGSKIIFWRDL